jgi:hypothetical protein
MPKPRVVALSLALAVASIGALVVVLGRDDAGVAIARVPALAPPAVAAPAAPPKPAPVPVAMPDDTADADALPLRPLPVDKHVPAAFAAALAKHLANTDYRVVQWWADDLDGDGIAENIAAICDGFTGFYIVQHRDQLLEADLTIDGRNHCPDEPPPPFRLRHLHRIVEVVNVHKAEDRYELAIRDHQLALLRQSEASWEAARDEHDSLVLDYEALTWREDEQWTGHRSSQRGVLVLAAPHVHRPTVLAGDTALTATGDAEMNVVLHLHADRPVAACTPGDDWCHPQQIDHGDADVASFASAWLSRTVFFAVGGKTVAVRVARYDADAGYPAPPPS